LIKRISLSELSEQALDETLCKYSKAITENSVAWIFCKICEEVDNLTIDRHDDICRTFCPHPGSREIFIMDKIIIRQRCSPFKAFKVGDFDEANFHMGYKKAEKLVQAKNNYPGEYAIVVEKLDDDEVFDLG